MVARKRRQATGRAGKRERVRRGWTADEDARIWEFVRVHGSGWSKLATSFDNRTDDSLRNRYRRIAKRIAARQAAGAGAVAGALPASALHLAMGGRGMWTADETRALEEAVANYGMQWHLVAERLPGRGVRSVRHHYDRLRRGTSQVASNRKMPEPSTCSPAPAPTPTPTPRANAQRE